MIGTVRIRALCAIFAFALGGCVSIDSRASREEVDAAATQAISGEWIPLAVYGTYGRQSLGDLVGGSHWADRVQVNFDPAGRIAFEFWYSGQRTGERVFGPDRLRIDEGGAIEVKPEGGCRFDGALECDSDTLTMFVNPQHEMVIVRSHLGGGVLLSLLLVGYQKTVATFIRRTGDPDLDNIPRIAH